VISPAHGSYPANTLWMTAVPRVSVSISERKPMSPRAGMMNSIRTQPLRG